MPVEVVQTSTGLNILLDSEDAARLWPQKICIGKNGEPQLWDADSRQPIQLTRWILGIPVRDPRRVRHINDNQLDNRRVNLCVVDRQVA